MINNFKQIKGKRIKNIEAGWGQGIILTFEDGTIADIDIIYFPDGTIEKLMIDVMEKI